MPSTRTGIIHQPHGKTTLEYLPLEEVRVRAWVVDVSSRIVLTQTFHNLSDKPTGGAKYVFPLPANAAVCAFELKLDDGSVILGEIKEKEEAKQIFTSAVEQGKTTALVERVTDDIFTISVGSIPAATKVEAHLTFVMDLLDEALTDHIRLQLPMYIAERYGTPPAAMKDAAAADSRTRVHITVDIQTSDVIHAVRSPTHHITLHRYKERSGRRSERRMSVTWHSPEFLKNDFVVTIHADGLDRPRCFAEMLNTGEAGNGQSSIAMQLTLVPKFQSPKISSQEYIFIMDRSGSMDSYGSMETAKRTLQMLLRLLPGTQTTFNIFSFGSKVTSLWSSCRALDPAALGIAVSHVDGMNADYGGTEIPRALQKAFDSRVLDRPSAVFLLTDGQVTAREDPWTIISNAIQNSPPQAPVRLFVLGIGSGVSSDICSSLARHGNGEALFALSAENIVGKCARLLNAARSKNIESIHIDWGYSAPTAHLSPPIMSNLPASIPALEPPPPLQQAPHSLTKIFSGIRFTVFVIATFATSPSVIRLITRLDGVSEPQELIVNVTKVKPFSDSFSHSTIPIVHTLAARRLIMELDDRIGPLPSPAPGDALIVSEDDLRMAGIVRLGLTYQLVSKHTSFIAVQKGGERRRDRGRGAGSQGWARSRLAQTEPDTQDTQKVTPVEEPTFLDDLIDDISSLVTSVLGFLSSPTTLTSNTDTTVHPRPHHRPEFPGTYDESDSASSRGRDRPPGRTDSLRSRSTSSHDSVDTFSSLSSLEASTCSACWTSSRSPSPLPRFVDPIERAPTPEVVQDTGAQNTGVPVAGPGPGTSRGRSTKRHPITQEVYDLVLEMAIDGSFTATPRLSRIVGNGVLSKADGLGIDKKVWATVVAVAYMKTELEDEPDLLDLMMEKAREFVDGFEWSRRDSARSFDEMVRRAFEYLKQSSVA